MESTSKPALSALGAMFLEQLFWKTLSHLQGQLPGFGLQYKGIPGCFKTAIHAIDSSTIPLIANCADWAKHRRRKAVARLHLRLDLQSFLPGCAIIEEASRHDDTRAPALCAGLQAGEIALFEFRAALRGGARSDPGPAGP